MPKITKEQMEKLHALGTDLDLDPQEVGSMLHETGFEVYDAEIEDKAEWAKQNPKTAALGKMGEGLQNSLPMRAFGKAVDFTLGNAQRGIEAVKEVDPTLKFAIEKRTGVMAGKEIAKGLGGLEEVGDDLQARTGQSVIPNALRATAQLKDFVPQSEMDMLTIATPNAKAVKAAKAAAPAMAKGTEFLLNQIPSSRLVLDRAGAISKWDREVAQFSTQLKNVNAQRTEVIANLYAKEYFSLNPQRIKDYHGFGKDVVKNVNLSERAARQPLIMRSKVMNEVADKLPSDIPVDGGLLKKMDDIKDDLFGVISNTQDETVKKLVNKYLGLGDSGVEIVDPLGMGAIKIPQKIKSSDLMKDRGRLGKLYTKLRESGVRDTEQSTAVLKMQEALDDELMRRANQTGDLQIIDDLQKLRSDWRGHYQKWYSDTAVDLRKAKPEEVYDLIKKSETNIDEAFAVMDEPAKYQVKKAATADLWDKMMASKKPDELITKALKNDGESYWNRILDKDEIKSIREAAELKKQGFNVERDIERLSEEINKADVQKNRRSGDPEWFGKMNRADDQSGRMMFRAGRALGTGGLTSFMALSMGAPQYAKYAAAATAIGVAPELLAEAYVRGTPMMKKAIEYNITGRGKNLGKLAPYAAVDSLKALMLSEGFARPQENQNEAR